MADLGVPRITVDSADTDSIRYFDPSPRTLTIGPAWFFNTSGNLPGAVYNDSLTGCDTSGASAVFRFHAHLYITINHAGSGVSVMGTVSPTDGDDAAVSLYSVDGDNPTFFTTPRVNERTDAVQFFASGPLPLGDHVLIINVTAASRAAPYYLDYLQYTIDTLPIPSSSTSPATKSAPLVIHLLSQRTLASSPTASVFAAETKHTAPVGAVVGGVVGGLALIFVLIALLHWKHKRHPASEFEYGTQAQQGVPTLPLPYGVTAPAPSPVSTSTVEDTTSDVPSSSRRSTPLPPHQAGNHA